MRALGKIGIDLPTMYYPHKIKIILYYYLPQLGVCRASLAVCITSLSQLRGCPTSLPQLGVCPTSLALCITSLSQLRACPTSLPQLVAFPTSLPQLGACLTLLTQLKLDTPLSPLIMLIAHYLSSARHPVPALIWKIGTLSSF